jgi:hypothetical protein
MLINSNQNNTQISPSDAQMFHQTFAAMLSQPWSPQIYSTTSAQPAIIQNLLISLDQSIQNINDSEPKFEFQSEPLSTISLRLPSNQKIPEIFAWEITNDNQIQENFTNLQSINPNITSSVFLKLNNTSNCLISYVIINKKKCFNFILCFV